MKRYMKRYIWPAGAVAVGVPVATLLAVYAGWFVDAAQNSSGWLRGKLVDEGLWVLAVFVFWSVTSLVAARVLALCVWPRKQSKLGDKNWLITACGFVLILLGTATWTLIGTVDPVPAFDVLVSFAVGSVVAGMIMLGLGLGQRLRLQINVIGPDGTTSAVKSAYVAARMEALGTSRPRGLEFPHGTDVANLPETALSTAATHESKIAAALLSIFRSVAFITPWKADVVIVDSETAAVTLRRNGRRLDSQLISSSLLLPDSPKRKAADVDRAVLTTAAAYILFSLSKVYPKLEEGMSGATNWRGVAAQVLATTLPWKNDTEASLELFARAVDEDPGNLAAWLGYLVKRTGSYGTPETLEWVLKKLKTLKIAVDHLDRDQEKEIALRVRLLRTLTIFHTNYRIQLPKDEESKQKRIMAAREALHFASSLMDVIDRALSSKHQPPSMQDYVTRIRPLAASLYLHVLALVQQDTPSPISSPAEQERVELANSWMPKEIPETEPKETEMSSLRFHYDRACALLEEDAKKHPQPLAHLEFALSLKELRSDAESDPSLRPVRKTDRFAALTDKRVRITSLSALKSHSEQLAADGIRFASEFVARKDGDNQLSASLKVAEDTVKWMRGICELSEGCFERELAAEWTNLLTDEGINNAAALRDLVRRGDGAFGASHARITRKAEIASVAAPTKDDLRLWASEMPVPAATVQRRPHATRTRSHAQK